MKNAIQTLVLILVMAAAPFVPHHAMAQVNLVPQNGWKAFAIVTQGDDISAIADAGYGNIATRGKYDGLGVFRNGSQFTVWLNHETSSAAISRIELDRPNFRLAIQSTIDNGQTPFPATFKSGMGYAYDSIYDGTYHAINNPNPVASGTVAVGNYGDANFDRFCSGTSTWPSLLKSTPFCPM